MKHIKSFGCRLGFTLIELLVVIATVGVLIAAALPMIRGTSDSAMAAKCMANMRNIAEATLIYASRDIEYGYYPSAGFFRYIGFALGDPVPKYKPRRPWISNMGSPANLDKNWEGKKRPGKEAYGNVAHFTEKPNYEKPDDHNNPLFAVKHGAIWAYTGQSFDVYRCPVHTSAFEKAHKYPPSWSFVMNGKFGFDSDGKGVHGFNGQSVKSSTVIGRPPDKVLMFAEVQGLELKDKKHKVNLEPLVNGADFKTDAILEHDKENIGFNHPLSKGRYCGHVAFADGHVEKIVMPQNQGNIKELTKWLCSGVDVVYDGGTYSEAN